MSGSKRRARVNRDHTELSVVKQCSLLGVSRSAVYYQPTPISPDDLELMGLLDRQLHPPLEFLHLQGLETYSEGYVRRPESHKRVSVIHRLADYLGSLEHQTL